MLAWRAYRERSVVEPLGDLALVAMYVINGPTKIDNIPGQWSPAEHNRAGLILQAGKEDGLYSNGECIDGTIHLEPDQTIIKLSDSVLAVATEQPGSKYLLAIYNQSADAVKNFKSIACYDEDRSWILEGKYVQSDKLTFNFSHTADQANHERIHQSLGEVHVEIAGRMYQLRPFNSGNLEIIVFRDATSGQETYSMGRMLIVEKMDNGTVKLDFNRAFLPPCAFSPFFNCPMPPASNRIDAFIRAGEKQVVFNK